MLKPEDRPLIAIVVAIVAIVVIAVWSPTHQSDKNNEGVSQANQSALIVSKPMTPEDREADATETIAKFTVVLAIVAAVAGGLTYLQISLARDEFNATHRPILYVRNLSLVDGWKRIPIRFGGPIDARFIIANKGGTAATIIGGYLEVCWSDAGVPPDRIYEVGVLTAGMTLAIAGGGSKTFDIQSGSLSQTAKTTGLYEDVTHGGETIFGRIRTRAYILYRHPEPPLYVFGWIQFRGDNDAVYQMGFCRKWDDVQRAFRRVDDPDFEYEA